MKLMFEIYQVSIGMEGIVVLYQVSHHIAAGLNENLAGQLGTSGPQPNPLDRLSGCSCHTHTASFHSGYSCKNGLQQLPHNAKGKSILDSIYKDLAPNIIHWTDCQPVLVTHSQLP